MKRKRFLILIVLLGFVGLFSTMSVLNAQMANGQSKFLGNIYLQGQTSVNFDYYWNQITPANAGKWASCEQNRGDFNYWLWLDRAYHHAKQNGFKFKEHCLVWGGSSGDPSWMSSVPQSEQQGEVLTWFDSLAARYPDFDMIDVVNEPLHAPPLYKDALGGDGTTGWDWVIWCYQQARLRWPNAKLILNEYNVLNYTSTCQSFLQIVRILQSRGLIDGIGCQAHSLETIPLSTIETNMDSLAATGLDIYISEYDVQGDDSTQLALYQQQFKYFWENPAVKGITLWGYVSGQMWRQTAYLLETDGVTERPALQWLRSYFNYNPQNVTYRLDTSTNGHGSLAVSPAQGPYAPFTDVTVTAVPDNGYVFNNWTGDVGGATNPVTLSMISNRLLTGNFVPKGYVPQYTLNVSISGNGTVTQNPVGTTLDSGTVVTLTAVPDTSNMFVGWSGSSTSTSSSIQLTMNGNKVLTASFQAYNAGNCNNPISESLPFVQNGALDNCYFTNGDISYVNSWNMDAVTINGIDYTNVWSNSMPPRVDGGYYIHYTASVGWAHLEVNGSGGTTSTPIAVTEVSVSPTTASVDVDSVISLSATVMPGNATDQVVTWSTSDASIATVDASGLVTGVNPGTATITATTDDGGFTASSQVTVNNIITNIAVTGVTVSPTSDSIAVNGTATLTATILPSNATIQTVSWSTSDPGVATVNSNGVVTGVASGNAVITVTTTDGGYTASSDINVATTNVPVSGITVSPTRVTVYIGETSSFAQLTATVLPSNATDKNVTWSSLDPSVAVVDANGQVSGVSGGNTSITATTEDGGYTASAAITVVYDSTSPLPCSNPIVIALPFTADGAGHFCWVTSQPIDYVNSWNMDSLEINGVDYSNVWSNTMPATINGNYYIYYVGSVGWAHFEVTALKSAQSLANNQNNQVRIYPIPFKNVVNIDLSRLDNVQRIELFNTMGQVIKSIDGKDITSKTLTLNIDQPGNIFILRINTPSTTISKIIVKQ